jgi:hypothetical protein
MTIFLRWVKRADKAAPKWLGACPIQLMEFSPKTIISVNFSGFAQIATDFKKPQVGYFYNRH